MADPRRDEDIVWRYLLERNAGRSGSREAAVFPAEGVRWSWGQLDEISNRTAHVLAELGVRRGDRVATLSENTSGLLAAYFGAAKLGAVIAPVNTAFHGPILRHVLELSEARVVVCAAELVDRLELDGPVGLLTDCLVVGAHGPVPTSLPMSVRSLEPLLVAAPCWAPTDPSLHRSDPYAVIFTSGTTGPSKGVLSPYGQIYAAVAYDMALRARSDDRFLVDLPLFHVGGMLSLETVLVVGATAVVHPRIHVQGYWQRVRAEGVTHATPMVLRWLLDAAPKHDDRQNPLERILISGWNDAIPRFCDRFGVAEAYGCFNMTEVSAPLLQRPKAGTIGRPRPGVDARLVDDDDIEVGEREVGELVLRTDLPWEMNLGYVSMPTETIRAWRNGWFHTGDLMRRDADGDFVFVDRKKDMIRVRGENVSSYEVERAIRLHPMVADCAVVPVRVDGADTEEVKACVVVADQGVLDPAALIEFARASLPRFMVPRYVEVYESLPMTTSHDGYGKVRKGVLRDRGVTPDTWDREAPEHRRRPGRAGDGGGGPAPMPSTHRGRR